MYGFQSGRLLATLLVASAAFILLPVMPSFAELVVTRQTTLRPDGSRIEWELTRPSSAWHGPLVVVAQGSSCESVTRSRGVASFSQVFSSDFAILLVEKLGVAWGDDKQDKDGNPLCSEVFNAEFTVQSRVDDYGRVLEEIKGADWWDGKLILAGGSEGGSAMAMLSQKLEPTGAILMSSIGDQTFGEMVLDVIGEEGRSYALKAFEEARGDPSGTKTFGGVSYAYWAKTIDLKPLSYITSPKTTYLIVQGGRNDEPTSVHARAAFDAASQALGCNVVYWELAGLDHGFSDRRGVGHIEKISRQLHAWANALVQEPESTISCR